jgi:hypothetical protein
MANIVLIAPTILLFLEGIESIAESLERYWDQGVVLFYRQCEIYGKPHIKIRRSLVTALSVLEWDVVSACLQGTGTVKLPSFQLVPVQRVPTR